MNQSCLWVKPEKTPSPLIQEPGKLGAALGQALEA